jgi:hypothetical protein
MVHIAMYAIKSYRNAMYSKLFSKIVQSSVWLESLPTRIVWITFLAVKDRDGFCEMAAIGNVARTAGVTLAEAQEAVKALESPDNESGDPAHEGRRIERVEGGWMVLNAKKYDAIVTSVEKTELNRKRVAAYRARKRQCNADVTQSNDLSHFGNAIQTETHTHTSDSDKSKTAPPALYVSCEAKQRDAFEVGEVCQAAYPPGTHVTAASWRKAYRMIGSQLRSGESDVAMIEGAGRYAAAMQASGSIGTQFVMAPNKFYGHERLWLEPWPLPATKAEVSQNANLEASLKWLAKDENAAAG